MRNYCIGFADEIKMATVYFTAAIIFFDILRYADIYVIPQLRIKKFVDIIFLLWYNLKAVLFGEAGGNPARARRRNVKKRDYSHLKPQTGTRHWKKF